MFLHSKKNKLFHINDFLKNTFELCTEYAYLKLFIKEEIRNIVGFRI